MVEPQAIRRCAWCETEFTPSRPCNAAKQRYCCALCRFYSNRKQQYQNDPEFREREKARQRAYYHQPSGGYTKKRLRELRGARQRVLGQLAEVRRLVD